MDPEDAKYKRDADMTNRVASVLAAVAGKQPLSLFDNMHFRAYIHKINPKHSLPHRLERNRIVEVIIDYAIGELSQIAAERRLLLGEGFMSANIDFYTDQHRKDCFGVLVMNLIGE